MELFNAPLIVPPIQPRTDSKDAVAGLELSMPKAIPDL